MRILIRSKVVLLVIIFALGVSGCMKKPKESENSEV